MVFYDCLGKFSGVNSWVAHIVDSIRDGTDVFH